MYRIATIGVLTAAATWSGAAHAGPQDGYLSVTNVRHDTVRVVIDRRSYGEVHPGNATAYRLPPGSHAVRILSSSGEIVEQETILITAYSAEAVILEAPVGELDITNQASASLRVWVDGEPVEVLRPGQHLDYVVSPGHHMLEVTYRQHDQRRALMSQGYHVMPGEVEHIRLQTPDASLVEVVNTYPYPVQLRSNGRTIQTLGPNAVSYVELPVGRVSLAFVDDRGRVLEQERVSVSAFREQTIRTEGIQHGAVSLYNPLPIPVRVVSGKEEHILQPGERARWGQVRTGAHAVSMYRLTGEPIGTLSVEVRPGGTTQAQVTPPSEGIITMTNNSGHQAYIYIDGRLVKELPAYSAARLSVEIGGRQVKVVAGGRERFNHRLLIERYEEADVRFGRGGRRGPEPSRSGAEVSIHW